MQWKYSSMGVRSLAVGIRSLPYSEQAFALMSLKTRTILENPNSAPWHDASVVIDSAEAVHRVGGDAGVEAMNHEAVRRSLGPVMSPFLSVTLALFGATPGSLLKRMNQSLKGVMKGVQTEWAPTETKSGILTITHPDDLRPVSWPSWKGSLLSVFDLCGVTGEIVPEHQSATARALVFVISWN